MTNELTHGETERRQADDECTKKHHKHKVTMVCYHGLLKNKSMIRLKQALRGSIILYPSVDTKSKSDVFFRHFLFFAGEYIKIT